jgi:hypothetical protein
MNEALRRVAPQEGNPDRIATLLKDLEANSPDERKIAWGWRKKKCEGETQEHSQEWLCHGQTESWEARQRVTEKTKSFAQDQHCGKSTGLETRHCMGNAGTPAA